MQYETLNELFFQAMETHKKPDVLSYKSGGTWQRLSWKDMLERVRNLALGLNELGVQRGDRVALSSENRMEWFVIDAALQMIGGVNVAIYSTLPAAQTAYIIRDSESKIVIASTSEQQAKMASVRGELGSVEHFIGIDPAEGSGLDALTLEEVAARGAQKVESDPELHLRLAAEVRPDDLAAIIYTSGTTGDPKGAMLTHSNLVSNAKAAASVLPITSSDISLSVLPYAHVFERLVALYLYPAVGVSIHIGESMEKIVDNLGEVRPTVMTSVPRLYEKMHARVLEKVSQGSPLRQKIFWWAMSVGKEHARYRLEGKPAPWLLDRKYKIATALAFKKLQERVGGRLRFFVSGAAPLARQIAEFFYSAGITILEGYGLTETSPVIAVNRLEKIKFGTVGPPIPDVEVKIAEDGEILARGPNVMKGYWRKEAATTEAIDEDGWFHTGDVGLLDSDNCVVITDRKKDLIVTAGGKNIAPQPIENRLKSNAYIAEVVLVGNRRRFASALVVPDFEKLCEWAEAESISTESKEDLVRHEKVVEFMQKQTEEVSADLAQFEKIKKITLLAAEFTIDGGELTPTLKVKRNVIEKRYRDLIDKMYD
jgi:long-chain acyl-CoA synthetase